MDTVLVLSGITVKDDLKRYTYRIPVYFRVWEIFYAGCNVRFRSANIFVYSPLT